MKIAVRSLRRFVRVQRRQGLRDRRHRRQLPSATVHGLHPFVRRRPGRQRRPHGHPRPRLQPLHRVLPGHDARGREVPAHHLGQRHLRDARGLRTAAALHRLVRLHRRGGQRPRGRQRRFRCSRASTSCSPRTTRRTASSISKIDTDKVGAMGHSQGGGATIAAARDPRIKAIIVFNSGHERAQAVPGRLRRHATSATAPIAAASRNPYDGRAAAGRRGSGTTRFPETVNGSTTGDDGAGPPDADDGARARHRSRRSLGWT